MASLMIIHEYITKPSSKLMCIVSDGLKVYVKASLLVIVFRAVQVIQTVTYFR